MASPADESRYHIMMFPWFAFGHMIPFLHLSNKLAERGHRISFLLPQKAHLQLQHQNLHPQFITFHILTVPHVEGLPKGTETASDIPISLTSNLVTAMDLTKEQVKCLIKFLNPDFVLYDFSHWVPEIARPLGIKSINFVVVCAASIAIVIVPAREIRKGKAISEEEWAKLPEGYPSSTVVLRGREAKGLAFTLMEFGSGITFLERTRMSMKQCDAISIRTCRETEGSFCDYISTQFGKRVILTGPMSPEPPEVVLEKKWANWLAGFEAGSVVFCAFGSQFVFEKDQFQELLLGFELTELPFFIATRPPAGSSSVSEAMPEGFEDRIQGRGVVEGGWVQQPLVLGHPSVGCFVSHCGFGSMWESLMSDCQIVLVPHLGDQILNTRLLAEELKVAVEVKREENGWFSKESLCKAIKSVMDKDSEVGAVVKKNHAKWKKVLVRPEFASGYIDGFVEGLHELKRA